MLSNEDLGDLDVGNVYASFMQSYSPYVPLYAKKKPQSFQPRIQQLIGE